MTLLMLYQDPSMNWEREGCSIDEIGRSCKEEKGKLLVVGGKKKIKLSWDSLNSFAVLLSVGR